MLLPVATGIVRIVLFLQGLVTVGHIPVYDPTRTELWAVLIVWYLFGYARQGLSFVADVSILLY